MIKLSCPYCGFSKEVPPEGIPEGIKRVACPKCRQKFPLEKATPAPSASVDHEPPPATDENPQAEQISIVCPHCSARRKVPRQKIPQRVARVNCPQCGKSFRFHGDRVGRHEVLSKPEHHPVLAMTRDTEPESPRRKALSGVGELFGKSWQVFMRRILVLIGINLLAICLAGIGYLMLNGLINQLGGSEGGGLMSLLATFVLVAYSMVVFAWAAAAVTYAIVEEDLGVRQSLGYGLQRIWSFLWVSLLVWFIIGGGYLLFVVPGVLFTLWFLFAQFVLAREDTRGMEALLKSKAYVAGYGWPVLGRIMLASVFFGLISVPLAFIPVLGELLGLLLGLYLMVYYSEILKELTEIKGSITFDCSRGVKVRWLLAGGAGFVLAFGCGLAAGLVG